MNTYWSRDMSTPFPFIEELPTYALMCALAYLALRVFWPRLVAPRLKRSQ
jgi:hypothetical protein